MPYKKKEVSKILNTPIETLRYFEQKKIIAPYVEPSNQYRVYTDNDLSRLIAYKRFRALDYSLSEAKKLTCNIDLQQTEDSLERQEQYIGVMLEKYENLLKRIGEIKSNITSAKLELNKVSIIQLEKFYYFINRYSEAYRIHESKCMQEWLEQIPYVD